jgi:putative tryptophan/tyrosine transport system substrate-binding protein
MKRREFITLLGGAAAAWPLPLRAQQRAALPAIGILIGGPTGTYASAAFHEGLNQAGYVEGRNVAIEYHWADSRYDRLPALAADFVRRQVSVIVTAGIQAALAAKAATSTIPIVFSVGVDPVLLSLVPSLNRPGGNLTGVTGLNQEVIAKRLQLLHEVVPATPVMAALVNPTLASSEITTRNLQAAARTLGLRIHVLHASNERDVDALFPTLRELGAGALVLATDEFILSQNARIAALALGNGVPTIQASRAFAVAGGLMSYGTNTAETNRTVGVYTGRILKGEKAADLPVQQATRIELIINMRTAKALGIAFPTALLVRADEVIE